MNNTNAHTYMQAVKKKMFTHIQSKKEIKLFGERGICTMIKEFKQLHEVAIPVKTVVNIINPE